MFKEVNLCVPNKRTRGRSHQLFYVPKAITSAYQNSPINRTIQLFNDGALTVDIFNVSCRQFIDIF